MTNINEVRVNSSVNLNEKSKYISYTSPILKNKKGHSRQMTKGISKIKKNDGSVDWEKVNEYIGEIRVLLSEFEKYSSDYNSYLEAKNKFSKFSIECVFEGSEFSNKYDQDSTKRVLERYIPVYSENSQYCLPSVLLAGVSAGGKTTTFRQIIGATRSSFPATMQANTTVGTFHAVVKHEVDELIGMARLMTRASLEERIRFAISDVMKKILSVHNLSENKISSVYDIIFDSLTIFDDRKCKLQYVISKKDLVNENVGETALDVALNIWELFKKEIVKTESELVVFDDFKKNNSAMFFAEFGEFVVEQIQEETGSDIYSLFEKIVIMISNAIIRTIRTMIDRICNDGSFHSTAYMSVSITDENKVHEFSNCNEFSEIDISTLKFPKVILLKTFYTDGRKPDVCLRNKFFEIMEHVSSASTERIGETLFPVIEEMRIYGNFRPLWVDDNRIIDDFIMVDSEGLGHDMSKEGISIELRNIISQARKIVFIQNGSEAISDQFAEALGLLITSGAIYKTTFCFNRMEKFDINSNGLLDSRISFIKSGIVNSIKKIVEDEEGQNEKIVTGKEHVYEELVTDNSLYFEHLSEIITGEEGIVPEFNKLIYDTVEQQIEMSRNIGNDAAVEALEKVKMGLFVVFHDEFHSVRNLNTLIQSFVKSNELQIERIKELSFEPHYSLYKFTRLFIKLNEEFANVFIDKVNNQLWQTVKAFNSRIAFDYDSREWSNLKPESEFIGFAQKKVISFLLNPENMEVDSQIRDKALFVELISNMMSSNLSKAFREIAENVIYKELLKDCWKPGIEQSGSGSTYVRKNIINSSFNKKFMSEIETDYIFQLFKQAVFANELMKLIKYKLN